MSETNETVVVHGADPSMDGSRDGGWETEGSIITDHEYEPMGEWWSRCKHCRLAEAAHARSKGA